MTFSFFKPIAELKPYVKSIWVFESPLGMPEADMNLAVPTGCSKLIFSYENSIVSTIGEQVQRSKEQNLYFVGNRDISVQVSTKPGRTGFIGIDFYPHGAYPVFGIPMIEIANRLTSADDLISLWGMEVNEGLRNIETVEKKIHFLQNRLIELLKKNQHVTAWKSPVIEYCINSLKSTNGLMAISELQHRTGYSRRYLEILFKNHIGLSLKTLGSIFRFQKFYKDWANGQPYERMMDELYNYYYDQAHFNKEFKRMTGFSPKYFSSKVSNEFGRQLTLH
ncbi:MAG TPA: DUF6597 domain-containing transcriptional factor [Ignavibacteriaceae bacterium]|nr:DUF6597 domain-containing transcriptional factor [Ignavibacteriaceae bacterium]